MSQVSNRPTQAETVLPSMRQVILVLLALATGGFAIGVTEFAAMSILPDFAKGLGVDEPTAGHVISAYAAGVVVGAPVLAVMGARFPRWLLLVVFMGLFAIGNGLSAIAPTYETMLLFRFLSGIPHGAYFGVAALMVASIVPLHMRSRAVSTTLLGLTVATLVGVPLANMISQNFGWRWTFAIVSGLAILTMVLVAIFAPRDAGDPDAVPLRELGALKNTQVWLTLGVGAIGFGGMFSVYAYLASTAQAVTGVAASTLPMIFAVFGVGMMAGNIIGGWAADRFGMKAAGGLLLWSAFALSLYALAAPRLETLLIIIVLIGIGGGLGSILQTRLMDVAGDAQTLAAALNHSAFNFANALGPLLGGMAISAGFGWTSTGYVGMGLALGGFAIWAIAYVTGKKSLKIQNQ